MDPFRSIPDRFLPPPSTIVYPQRNDMAPQVEGQTMASETTKKALDINSLMSPPELPPFDNFHQSASSTMRPVTPNKVPSGAPISPPISPFTHTKDGHPIESIPVEAQDPILYPSSDAGSSPAQPLFGTQDDAHESEKTIDEHVTARPGVLFRQTTPPMRDDYQLALYFKSSVMEQYTKNPRNWLRKERELLLADRRASNALRAMHQPKKPATQATRPSSAIRPPQSRVVKPDKPRRPIRAAPAKIAPQTPSAPPRQSGIRLPSATPEPRRMVAPNREDKDFLERKDYCPPLDTLPSKANSLKVDWKGNALDLSQDPNRDRLHPDELILAANLRLDCATYLTSKRRIFERRLECALIGKEFRKTDAQQACKIDVNKASKLWTAYEKVGWLDISHMARWMK